ncbi:alpha/beta fold hydrolase [Kitasatospora sp. NPDC057541]|uniref:alpha/beta fold hydrolase n=1 Tax=unclassified Kitasatospora TaxID=2633591 RepID=UPI0036BF7000
MSTFVLVPGFWLGGWAWDAVAEPLRAAGHTVHAVTLPGLADRAGEASPETGAQAHVDDLVDLLVREDLRDVVLVAHSGGTLAVSGAADRVPERIRRVVWVDSGPMAGDVAIADLWDPAYRAALEASLVDGWRVPLPSWEVLASGGAAVAGVDEAGLARFRALATDQPVRTLHEPLRLTGAADKLPKALVSCSIPLAQVREMIAAGHPYFAALGGAEWELRELLTGHWPMFSRPAETAAVLAELAQAE